MKRFALAIDLKDDPALIAEYERYHVNVPKPILQSLRDAGVIREDIYRVGTRLFMVLETTDDFTLEKKAQMDAANKHIQEWEVLMKQLQTPLPEAKPGEKWVVMKQVFEL